MNTEHTVKAAPNKVERVAGQRMSKMVLKDLSSWFAQGTILYGWGYLWIGAGLFHRIQCQRMVELSRRIWLVVSFGNVSL